MKSITATFKQWQVIKLACYHATGCLILAALAVGCSTLHIESAKNLAAIGKESTVISSGNIFISNDAYLRTMDAEAFSHGYAGTVFPQQLQRDYQSIQRELDTRKIVFTKLIETYEAFHNLASFNTADNMVHTINELGDAVGSYAKSVNKNALLTTADKNSITQMGGYAARRVHTRRVAHASLLIRIRLMELLMLLEDPISRTQLTTFNQNLMANRTAAITLLWERGLLDPTPLINDLAGDTGLKVSKEALKILASPDGTHLKEGLTLVMETKMRRRMELIEQGYDASVAVIGELIAKHMELEKGEILTSTELRGMITELQLITYALNPKVAF